MNAWRLEALKGPSLSSKSHSAYRSCNGDANQYLISLWIVVQVKGTGH